MDSMLCVSSSVEYFVSLISKLPVLVSYVVPSLFEVSKTNIMHACMCVCVCVRERERKKERELDFVILYTSRSTFGRKRRRRRNNTAALFFLRYSVILLYGRLVNCYENGVTVRAKRR